MHVNQNSFTGPLIIGTFENEPQALHWGEKVKKIGERSEPSGSLGNLVPRVLSYLSLRSDEQIDEQR